MSQVRDSQIRCYFYPLLHSSPRTEDRFKVSGCRLKVAFPRTPVNNVTLEVLSSTLVATPEMFAATSSEAHSLAKLFPAQEGTTFSHSSQYCFLYLSSVTRCCLRGGVL